MISDVHARIDALAEAGKNADALICLGDLLLYTDYEDPGNGIMGALFGAELNTEFIRLRTANRFDEARAVAMKKWDELGNREELINGEVQKQYEQIFSAMPTPTYITYGNVDRPEFWPNFKKEGMTDADIERMLKFKSVNPDAVNPGAVRGSNASDFISKQEGFRTDAYWDKTGWAIGNGSRTKLDGTPVKEGDKVTKEQATTMLNNYVDTVRSKLEKSVPTWNELNMNQQDALISFGYNVGPDFYGKKDFETITKALSTVDTLKTVPDALKLYKKSGGKVLNGLINRRKAEIDLWNSVVR